MSLRRRVTWVLGFGILTWLVPFVLSIFFYSPTGQPLYDIFLIKSILLVVASGFGAFLLVVYFRSIHNMFLHEGVIIGIAWLVINWVLDILILIPLSGMSIPTYFTQIGLLYLVIPFMSIAIGYSVEIQVQHLNDTFQHRNEEEKRRR